MVGSHGAGFVLPCDGGVEAAEGIYRLHWIVSAEGEGDVVVEEGAPGVGVFGAVGTEAVGGPTSCRLGGGMAAWRR